MPEGIIRSICPVCVSLAKFLSLSNKTVLPRHRGLGKLECGIRKWHSPKIRYHPTTMIQEKAPLCFAGLSLDGTTGTTCEPGPPA
jgi:hypothetical protein